MDPTTVGGAGGAGGVEGGGKTVQLSPAGLATQASMRLPGARGAALPRHGRRAGGERKAPVLAALVVDRQPPLVPAAGREGQGADGDRERHVDRGPGLYPGRP